MTELDVEKVRADFPILDRQINGKPLVYLDSGNTSQKPRQVIDAVREHYERHNANVARSVHTLGTEATEAYERARGKIAAFVGGRIVAQGGPELADRLEAEGYERFLPVAPATV